MVEKVQNIEKISLSSLSKGRIFADSYRKLLRRPLDIILHNNFSWAYFWALYRIGVIVIMHWNLAHALPT